jgi:NTE family protein
LIKFMMRRPPNSEIPVELRGEIGAFALSAKTFSEAEFVANIGSIAGAGAKWPRGYACTAVDAQDGSFHIWEESSGVELGRAMASSCAVPGIFPPITIHGRSYMDGGMRSTTNVDLVKGYERVLVVALLSSMAVEYMRAQVQREIDILTAAGAKVELVVPDTNSLALIGGNLMDGSRRGEIARAGVEQGRAEAARLTPFWN